MGSGNGSFATIAITAGATTNDGVTSTIETMTLVSLSVLACRSWDSTTMVHSALGGGIDTIVAASIAMVV
jgi:hypothetical protein